MEGRQGGTGNNLKERNKRPRRNSGAFSSVCLRPFNLTGAQAAGANINRFIGSVHNSFYLADIRLPCSVGLAMGMGYGITEHQAFSANLTLCHVSHLLTTTDRIYMVYFIELFRNRRSLL